MLEIIRKTVLEIASAPDLDAALDVIVERVSDALQVDACSIFISEEWGESRRLVLHANRGLKPEAIGGIHLRFDEGLVGLVAQRAEPVNLQHASKHSRYRYFPESGEEAFDSFLGVPIIHQREVYGVLVVQQSETKLFGEDVVTYLFTLAAQLAGTIAHALVEQAIRQPQGLTPHTQTIKGLPGAPGVAMGEAVIAHAAAALEEVPDRIIQDPEAEIQRFRRALEATEHDIRALGERMRKRLPSEDRALFDAYAMILRGDSLAQSTADRIRAGLWAPAALRDTIAAHARMFSEMEDSYLQERAKDIQDLGRRILLHLQDTQSALPEYPEHSILVSDELSVSELALVPHERLRGLVSVHGSGSSHVAILARALGVPAVMGAADLPIGRLAGKPIVIDGYRGRVVVQPNSELRAEYQRLIEEETQLQRDLLDLVDLPAVTPDGVRIDLCANAGLQAELNVKLAQYADGIGLYRTEIPFLIRDRFPGELEQKLIYRVPLETFAPRPVVLRTLDIGGDKNLAYFPIHESNPFLGWRGIRVTLDHPEIFLTQVRAMLGANQNLGNLRILLPMVSQLEELHEAKRLINQAANELSEEGVDSPYEVGAMIEVPSAVYQIEAIAQVVDFISVGTNDLTQYLLAVDRNNERVAKLYYGLHPAVLRALSALQIGAQRHGKTVSVCGEIAGDPRGALLLLGLGVDSLSMSSGNLLRVKAVIRHFRAGSARMLTEQALALDTSDEVRELVNHALESAGLGGLIRAGK